MNRHVLHTDIDAPLPQPTELRLGLLDGQWVVATEDIQGWVVLGTGDRLPDAAVVHWATVVPVELTRPAADRSVPGIPDAVFAAAGIAARTASFERRGFDAVVHEIVRASVDAWLLAQLEAVRSGYPGGAR